MQAIGNLNRNVTVTDNSIFAGGSHTSRSEEDELVFAFEVELSGRWRLNRCLSLVGGYRLLFVDDVVRANDAMDFNKSFSGAVQAVLAVQAPRARRAAAAMLFASTWKKRRSAARVSLRPKPSVPSVR